MQLMHYLILYYECILSLTQSGPLNGCDDQAYNGQHQDRRAVRR